MTEVHEVMYDNYKIWKRNSLILYDLCITHVLAYPALSLDFQPVAKRHQEKGQALLAIAFTTNTPLEQQREQNYIFVKQLVLPSVFTGVDQKDVISTDNGLLVGGFNSVNDEQQFGRLVDLYQLETPLEFNQVAFCPSEPELLAGLSDDTLVLFSLKSAILQRPSPYTPQHDFGDSDGGFALCIGRRALIHGGGTFLSVYTLTDHHVLYQTRTSSQVNAAHFSPFYDDTVAYCTDDGELVVVDVATRQELLHLLLGDFQQGFVATSLEFSPSHENLIFLGSQEGYLMIFDLQRRNDVFCERKHDKAIYQLRASPFYDNLIVTGSEDTRIQMHRLGNGPDHVECKTIFVHQGHTMPITDVKFHPLVPNLLASSAEDNSLQFWWPSERVFR